MRGGGRTGSPGCDNRQKDKYNNGVMEPEHLASRGKQRSDKECSPLRQNAVFSASARVVPNWRPPALLRTRPNYLSYSPRRTRSVPQWHTLPLAKNCNNNISTAQCAQRSTEAVNLDSWHYYCVVKFSSLLLSLGRLFRWGILSSAQSQNKLV
jgi:hypothetical protein